MNDTNSRISKEAEPKFLLVCARCGYRVVDADPEMMIAEAEELHKCEMA